MSDKQSYVPLVASDTEFFAPFSDHVTRGMPKDKRATVTLRVTYMHPVLYIMAISG